ncbi:MAG: hypothetical protein Q4G26_12200 [Paracoccus sp. (in: a-proteobacteria)]|nr:hypothetical protein [Paracoccus sp. (in: a-proteobacteria)]
MMRLRPAAPAPARLSVLAVAALLALPPSASAEGVADQLLDQLLAACDRKAAVNPAALMGLSSSEIAGVSGDGKIIMRSTMLTEPPSVTAVTAVAAAILPGGMELNCTLTIIRPQDDDPTGLIAAIDSRATAILGADPARIGGPMGNPEAGYAEVITWASPEFPPLAQLNVTTSAQVIAVSLIRRLPEE